MKTKLKKLALMLTIMTILLSFPLPKMKIALSDNSGRKIDIFTQKEPYNGKGPNTPSDAFHPQELVILFANVTYNDSPVSNKLVAFQVNNPANEFWNLTVIGVNSTNDYGIAQFSFRIPWPSENSEAIIFGEWVAVATVDIAGVVVNDTLTFRVGWIIEIKNITILNESKESQTKFFMGETIFFNLTVKNIAFTTKFGAITVDVQDAANNPIMHVEISNVAFESGISHVLVSSQIPITSMAGEATVSAGAHTALPKEGGVPYCPAIFSTFEILPPLVKRYYLTVKTEPPGVAVISGEGWYDESVSVNLIAPKEIIYINIGVRYLFHFWDVDGLSRGIGVNEISVFMDANHTATAHYIVQYYLTVRVDPIGVTSISGEGWYDNGTNVSLFAPDVAGYNFSYWDVDGVSQGGAVNPITVFMNAPHTVTAHYVKIMIPAGWLVPYWFWWLLLLLILIILLLLIWLYLRRRRKKSEEAFRSGWTAWYYGYDLRKIRRV